VRWGIEYRDKENWASYLSAGEVIGQIMREAEESIQKIPERYLAWQK